MKKEIRDILKEYSVPILFLTIYLLFPTNNSVTDGWGYAEEIKHGYNLFRPHHLFYNVFGYLLINLFKTFGLYPDVLSFMIIINSIIGFLILVILNAILKNLNLLSKNKNIFLSQKNFWLLFVGSSFGFWRFTTENEVYLIPILLSLISIYYFLKYLKDNKSKNLILVSIFACLAPLFHQLHIFWWISIAIGIAFTYKKKKHLTYFILISLTIPISYFFTIIFVENQSLTFINIKNFIFREYIFGGADTTLDYRNLLLSPISFLRSFYQIHGNIQLLVKAFPWLYILGSISLLLLFWGVFQIKNIKIVYNKNKNIFLLINILSFTLILLFSIFSHGNAEFMVALLPLIPLISIMVFQIPTKAVALIATSMFIWNFSFAIIPNNRLDYNNDKKVVEFIEANPTAVYILTEKNIIANQFYYKNGYSIEDRLFQASENIDYQKLFFLQKDSVTIYSDAFSKTTPLSRATITNKFNKGDKIEIIEKGKTPIESFYGSFTLDKVKFIE